MTPYEIMRVGGKKEWDIRVFPNKFPAVEIKEPVAWKSSGKWPEVGADAYGSQEVVVETPRHDKQMADLGVGRIARVFRVCAERQRELMKLDGIKHVAVFKNKGWGAGTSLMHSHMQIAALPVESKEALEEARAEKLWRQEYGRCGYCELAGKEIKGERAVAENEHFACFAPWASRFGYELMFLPKRHLNSLTELRPVEFECLAELVKAALAKLAKLGADYNLYFHGSPKGEDLHFHAHLTPRVQKWAGFEFESGAVINSFSPEGAAEFYRGGKKK
jgi:UDPglucose--hexose-1-phosphate uridylyltransferase